MSGSSQHRGRIASLVVAVALAAPVAVVGSGSATADVSSAAAGTITGKVFRDLDVDGTLDGGEVGASGATVKAYDSTGALVGTATTDGSGNYSLSVTGAATTSVRVEFTSPDRWSQSYVGTDNGGDVQFVEIGATNVNNAVQQPGQYCTNNNELSAMRLAVTTMVPGGTSSGSGLPQTGNQVMGNCYRQSVSTVAWDDPLPVWEDGAYSNMQTPTRLTRNLETGALFGLGFDGGTSLLWGSAVIRRHSGLGPKGVGGVYAMATDGSGVVASFDLTQAPWNLVVSDGRDLSDAGRDISTASDANVAHSADITGYTAVGKIGFGELEVDPIGGYLWVVNLYQKKLHRIPISGSATNPTLGSSVTSYTIPQSVCSLSGSIARPFALRLDPTTYTPIVGGVCTNEAAAILTNGYLQGTTDVPENGWVMSLDTGSSTFTTLTTFSFEYPHYADMCVGLPEAGSYPLVNPADYASGQCWATMWHQWTDDWEGIQNWWVQVNNTSATSHDLPGAYAQPMLTGIDVLADGSLVVGVADRMNYQTGWYNAPPTAQASDYTYRVAGSVSGEVMLLCKSGATYTRESSGDCGSYDSSPRVWAGPAAESAVSEFFDDNLYGINPTVYSGPEPAHLETANGAVQVWPRTGTQKMAFTAMDPASELNSGGVRWNSTTTGDALSGVNLTSPSRNGTAGDPPFYEKSSFAKNVNMGGLEMICDSAPAEIGNRVWIDTDKDGLQDPGEPVAAGVTVHLYDSAGVLVGTAITDAKGQYYFRSTTTETAAGDGDNTGPLPLREVLQVRLDNPVDYSSGHPLYTLGATVSGTASVGGALAGASDSNLVGGGNYPYIPVPPIGAGTVDLTYDAGFVPVESVGSRVWIDANQNGKQDPGEGGLVGVKIELLNPDGSPANAISGDPAVTFSDAQGNYVLSGLAAGSYKVKFTLPDGVTFTEQSAAGTSSANDSNPDPTTGVTPVFTLAASATGDTVSPSSANHLFGVFSNPTIDAGVIAPPVGFGNWVWWNPSGDGSQEFDSTGIPGVKVEVFNADGTPAIGYDGLPVAPQYTGADGGYRFSNMVPGEYKAKFTPPPGYLPTTKYNDTYWADGDHDWDSNINPDGWTDVFTISPTATGDTYDDIIDNDWQANADLMNWTIDAGYTMATPLPRGALGNFVWYDLDADGIQDAGEPPVVGLYVGLFDANGEPALDYDGNEIGWVPTDANGHYLFDNLVPGGYKVVFDTLPGYFPTLQAAGADGTVDSNPGRDYVDKENYFGYETPLVYVNPIVSGDTVTDTDPSTLATLVNPTIDAGFVPMPSVALGNYVWYDADADGVQDAGETPIEGAWVTLLDANGDPAVDIHGDPVDPVETDANGYYFFDDLAPGEYIVGFMPPAGYAPTRQAVGTDTTVDSNPTTDYDDTYGYLTPAFFVNGFVGGDTVADVDAGTTATFVNPTIDAGFVALVAVGNYVWYDYDRDGIQDDDEDPVEGAAVTLLDENGDPALDVFGNEVTVYTDEFGYYFIDNLLPGDYQIQFVLPDDVHYVFTSQTSGDDGTVDSNPNRYTGRTPVFTISDSATGDTEADDDPDTAAVWVNPTIDAGVVPIVALSNYMWFDLNHDGVRDDGETPLEGGKVELLDANGDPVLDAYGNEVDPVDTDEFGYFRFDDLVPGDYRLKFTPPDGYGFTQKGDDDTDGADSNANRNGLTDVFSVEAYPVDATEDEYDDDTSALLLNPTVGAGVVALVAVGNKTWFDTDKDGIQDAGEPPVPNVLVTLLNPDGTPALDADGNVVAAVHTDANGYYLFDNLLPGDYRMQFTPPSGYGFTLQYTGTSANDSDANPVGGLTDVFTIGYEAGDDTVVDTNEATVAQFVNPTIDAGFIRANLPGTGGSQLMVTTWSALVAALGCALWIMGRRRRTAPGGGHGIDAL